MRKSTWSKRTKLSFALVFIAMPLVIYMGMNLADHKYYVVSVLLIGLSMFPFLYRFEKRKPQARELLILSVLSSMAVIRRTVFIFVPFCKPMISALYFLFLLTFVTVIEHPVYLGISFLTGLIYATKLKGKSAFLFGLLLLPGIGLYAYYYSRYNHFGMTNLRETAIGNMITLESILYGVVRGLKASSLLLWLLCVHEIFTTDKIVYLLGRISPKLSLYFAILLRTAPKTITTAHRIQSGQEAMGRGIRQGNFFRRAQNLLRVGSILLTFMTESFVETADSMRSRGYGLKGRTAFSLYRFDNRDRAVVVTLFLGTALLGSAYLLDQMTALYDPKIILNPITGVSVLFYLIYALLALLPMLLQCLGEWSFEKNRKRLPERG